MSQNPKCRICMGEKPQQGSIFSRNISMKIMKLADVKIAEGDGLPVTICMLCESELFKCLQFIIQIQWADKKFREDLLTQESVEECFIKQEFHTHEELSDDENNCDQDSDEETVNDETNTVDTREKKEHEDHVAEPLSHVDIVEGRGVGDEVEMADDPFSQEDPLIDAQENDVSRLSFDPFVNVKQEVVAMDTDTNNAGASTSSSSMPQNKLCYMAKRKLWDKIKMVKAIQAVRTKQMGALKASKTFNVPRATLHRLARSGKPQEEAAEIKLGRKPIIGGELEKELIKYLLFMESKFYGLTGQDVRRVAYQLFERYSLKHKFSEDGLAGKAWLNHFIYRHKDILSVLRPANTPISMENGFNKEAINDFFNHLEDEYNKHEYTPNRIYNVAVTGVYVEQKKNTRVILLRGQQQIGNIDLSKRRLLLTVVSCMSAGGTLVPPLLIFPRQDMKKTLMHGAPPGSIGRCHPSGWIQPHIFTHWVKHFIEITKPSKYHPILLILDGHDTLTKNIDVVDLAQEHHVALVSFPPHTSHKVQPLGKSFLGPLKDHYCENIRQWMSLNERTVGPDDIVELFGKAYLSCQAGLIADDGFRRTGVFPCNRNLFNDNSELP